MRNFERKLVEHLRTGNTAIIEVIKYKSDGEWLDCYIYTPMTYTKSDLEIVAPLSDELFLRGSLSSILNSTNVDIESFQFCVNLIDHVWTEEDLVPFEKKSNEWVRSKTVKAILCGGSFPVPVDYIKSNQKNEMK
jgi:hypothetical protein